MKYLVAVSGGIDSVVLLDQLVRHHTHEIIVAHFDHGIRPDSADDARFVAALAASYGLPCVVRREELGAGASEARARGRRYAFLRAAAAEHQATLVTAHHANDVVETVAINLLRGTGWRGLAVLGSEDIARPLLGITKQQLRQYALKHRLEWVEDSTNATSAYLRNRLRRQISERVNGDDQRAVGELRAAQIELKRVIDQETERFITTSHTYERYFLINCVDDVAKELLRAQVCALGVPSPTRPQLERALLAVKTARHGTNYELGGGVTLSFTRRLYSMKTR